MELHEVPRYTYVRVIDENVKVPPAAPEINADDIILFSHIDGMYSYCHDMNGNVVHLAAWTEVEIVEDP